MSLPSTGYYRASVEGHEVHFNGEDWRSDLPFFDLYRPLLRHMAAQETFKHSTIEIVARAVLRRLFPGFQELDFRSDTWTTPLGEGGVD